MSLNDYRKCAKCGKTRAEDMTVTYHRFPKPGTTNFTKATAWAKYCWPNKDWTSVEFLHSLYTTNKVLCGRHFSSTQFYDNTKQKLCKFAIPDSTEAEELLSNRENVLNQNMKQSSVEVKLISRVLFSKIDNIQTATFLVEPSTSAVFSVQTSMEVPRLSESKDNEQNEPINMLTPESISIMNIQSHDSSSSDKSHSVKSAPKNRSAILSAINESKLSKMTPREIRLYNVCRKKLREIIRLQKKIKNKKTNMIKTIFEDENVRKLCNLNISNSFVLLLQSQLKNCPKQPKGRYTLQQKIMALVIYKKSPAFYRLLRRLFTLPCQSSLKKLLDRVPLKPGINRRIFDSLKIMSQIQTHKDNMCILSFHEMSISKHLYYDLKMDETQGFQDQYNHGRVDGIATKALVFMLAGLTKKWKQPIAFYFLHTLTVDRMTMILKEILTECFNSNMNVVATVCDLSTVNRIVLKTMGASTNEPFFLHHDREIVAILDPPHLLKYTRNLLMKHDVECITNIQCNETTDKGTVKWSYIKELYNLDKDNAHFVFAPALTDYHLHPNVKQQKRVELATQVFSHSVAVGILAKIASNELPAEAHATAMFVRNFDELFDAVNSDSPDLHRGKKYSTNLTARTRHLTFFREMRRFISSMKFLGIKSNPPSQEGWIHTLNAIERLWKNLQALNIKSLSTRRLNQDPLQNYLECIRYNCGSNTDPTIHQFVAGAKTSIISNLRHLGEKKNCEDDTAVLANNLSSFLTADIPFKKPI